VRDNVEMLTLIRDIQKISNELVVNVINIL
jgi:hypothetical protein